MGAHLAHQSNHCQRQVFCSLYAPVSWSAGKELTCPPCVLCEMRWCYW